mmetsp:Transcript_4507/g.13249  ORF Transcript_4507/g.13249 Transcript_4507/m.13249 type:complete len:222 (-) Transcript_4507:584-1249(-)
MGVVRTRKANAPASTSSGLAAGIFARIRSASRAHARGFSGTAAAMDLLLPSASERRHATADGALACARSGRCPTSRPAISSAHARTAAERAVSTALTHSGPAVSGTSLSRARRATMRPGPIEESDSRGAARPPIERARRASCRLVDDRGDARASSAATTMAPAPTAAAATAPASTRVSASTVARTKSRSFSLQTGRPGPDSRSSRVRIPAAAEARSAPSGP